MCNSWLSICEYMVERPVILGMCIGFWIHACMMMKSLRFPLIITCGVLYYSHVMAGFLSLAIDYSYRRHIIQILALLPYAIEIYVEKLNCMWANKTLVSTKNACSIIVNVVGLTTLSSHSVVTALLEKTREFHQLPAQVSRPWFTAWVIKNGLHA